MDEEEKFKGFPVWIASYSSDNSNSFIAVGTGIDISEMKILNISDYDCFKNRCPLCGEEFDELTYLCSDCMKYYEGDTNVHDVQS